MRSLDHFRQLMLGVRNCRRGVVCDILENRSVSSAAADTLSSALQKLQENAMGSKHEHHFSMTNGTVMNVCLLDEICSLRRDMSFLEYIRGEKSFEDFANSLTEFHPVGSHEFWNEEREAKRMLSDLIDNSAGNTIDFFITDWDGTMKTYCSNYTTCMQPIYSAVILAKFTQRFTKFAAVLTAGPLYDIGILDLVCIPDGYLTFGGSWGQEWVFDGQHVVNELPVAPEDKEALATLADMIGKIYEQQEFEQFRFVGSGFQRKVDRVTMGHQNVSKDIGAEQSKVFLDAIYSVLATIDPDKRIFSTHLAEFDLELILKTGLDEAFTKADGVASVLKHRQLDIRKGTVLVCGDTLSDLPMVKYAKQYNENTHAVFVNAAPNAKSSLLDLLNQKKCCFVGSPDVTHIAMAEICGFLSA